MNTCVTGKRLFDSEELAIDALVQHHTINNYAVGQGPINVYQCNDCGHWHFTSKGMMHDSLSDVDNLQKMKLEREALDWERKLR